VERRGFEGGQKERGKGGVGDGGSEGGWECNGEVQRKGRREGGELVKREGGGG